jgi:hypothetical protein
MPSDANPFAALSLIVAPAILTNACSVLIMSTSNRFARTVDRARVLSREIEGEDGGAGASESATARRLSELTVVETRSLLLLRAMRSGYMALSGFASAALLSLVGAVLVSAAPSFLGHALEALAIAALSTCCSSARRGCAIARNKRRSPEAPPSCRLRERRDATRR